MTTNRPLRVFRWLPWLTAILVIVTWYAETRMERLEMAGANLILEGDFDKGPPGGPAWEIAAPAEGLWQPVGGLEGGAALRLPSGAVLGYRLAQAHRNDGYFVGLCLRGEGQSAEESMTGAFVHVGKAGVPSLALAPHPVVRPSADGTWHCGLAVVSVPFGFDEVVMEVRPAAPGTLLWVDRFTLYPAISPPLYELAHVLLVVAWLVLGAFVVVGIWYPLGPAGGIVVLAALVLILGVLTGGDWRGELSLPDDVDAFVRGAGESMDPAFGILRVFTGDRTWRAVGEVDALVVSALALLGAIAAAVVGWRYRWTERPWARAFVVGILFGLALQALRILLHVPGFATLHWALDPLALGAGLMVGALVVEALVWIRLRAVV